jgi:NADPH:quinone reductase-like Zn-dependent oxidoreductase
MTKKISGTRSACFDVKSVRLQAKAEALASISPEIERLSLVYDAGTHVLIEVTGAAVNPSDVKAAIGMMPYAVFPRTPGRDFAGTVLDGPGDLVGKVVFGSSGDLGIRRDGTHSTHLVVEADAVVEKPQVLTALEAAGLGVPFVTAMEGLRRAGMPKAGETVLVLGVHGKVGQAVSQIAAWMGASVIGVSRREGPMPGRGRQPILILNSETRPVVEAVRDLTQGRGADLIFNTVGEAYYELGTDCIASGGRQVFIASERRSVPFDIFKFYRARATFVGVDTLALSSVESGELLRQLASGFESKALAPFDVSPESLFSLEETKRAYDAVMAPNSARVIIKPSN